MSHYERRLEADLEKIRSAVLDVATAVDNNLEAAIRALLTADTDLAFATILQDHPINRAVEAVDDICHQFVVRHLPSAGHLRFISSVLRMDVELERIGDYAETICREVASLHGPIEGQFRNAISVMGRDAIDMYRQAIKAFREENPEQALATKQLAKGIERDFHVAYEQLAAEGETGVGSARDRFSKLVVLSSLERVSDQAKNLCEDVVWAISGERKKRRPLRILFLDRTNAVLGPLAIAAGRKSHPQSGMYEMAAVNPVAEVRQDVTDFLAATGHNGAEVSGPRPIDWPVERWGDFDVIVSLEGGYNDYVARIPFNSVGLTWEIATSGVDVQEIYRELQSRVVDLMDTVRGTEGADGP